ncbi:MAG: hypothetical protein A2041_05760 [Bacteroidetes bacterium GWA2_31_9b]|nr:MAG: hypothetical protein A2041_05760 [Bacteroidetes bacterium GWA2_31_9b]
MKYSVLFFLILFLGIFNNAFSQDVILLKNGEEIKAFVNEIDINIIKYKKFENPNGPIYNLKKTDVISVTYENGTKDVFSEPLKEIIQEPKQNYDVLIAKHGIVKQNGTTLSKNEVRSIMVNNNDALELYNSGKNLCFTGEIFSYAGLGIILIAAVVESKEIYTDNSAAIVGVIGGVACLATSMTVTFTGRSKIKKSVALYNSSLQNQQTYKIGIGLNQNGIAFTMNF